MVSNDVFSKAKHIRSLVEEKNLKIKDIAVSLKMKPSYVCHILRLNRLPELIIDGYYTKLIMISHLFIISRLKDVDAMIALYEKVLSEGLTVLQTEMALRDELYKIKTEGSYLPKEKKQKFAETMKQKSDAFVSIIQSRIRSKISVEFKGNLRETSAKLFELMKKLEPSVF